MNYKILLGMRNIYIDLIFLCQTICVPNHPLSIPISSETLQQNVKSLLFRHTTQNGGIMFL